jgi:hypothetical protein
LGARPPMTVSTTPFEYVVGLVPFEYDPLDVPYSK